jgi:hypothetical protein
MAAPESSTPSQLGEHVDDGVELFRGFADKNFRERKTNSPHVVRYWAYLLREDDVADGLSVGLTPKSSVKYLTRGNFGYGSIMSESVTALPDGLSVRRDVSDLEHAYICNLPLRSESDEKLKAAMRIAKDLARKSKVITCDPYPSS